MKKRILTCLISAIAIFCFGFGLVACETHTHQFSKDWTYDETYHWHAAMCEHTDEVADKAEHDFRSNGVCKVCDYNKYGGVADLEPEVEVDFSTSQSRVPTTASDVVVQSDNLVLTKMTNGEYSVTDVVNKSATKITVPETVNGIKVSSIASGAFAECSSLTELVLSDNVIEIGAQACCILDQEKSTSSSYVYIYCKELTTVVLGKNVETIGDYAFNNCSKLKKINTADATSNFSGATSLKTIGQCAFYGCSALAPRVDFSSTLEEIGQGAFYQCKEIRGIGFGDGQTSLKSIGYAAFAECTLLNTVVVPDSVTSLGQSFLSGCEKVESLTVPFIGLELNDSYYLGIFFASSLSDSTTAATANKSVPSALKSLTITKCVELADETFYGCSGIQTISLPDTLLYVGEDVFEGCTALTGITTSENGKYIGNESNPYYVLIGAASNYVTTLNVNENTVCIAGGALKKCENIDTFSVSDNLASVGANAFAGKASKATMTIRNGEYYVGPSNNPYKILYRTTSANGNYTVNANTKAIAGGAFSNVKSLVSVTVPDGVTVIGNNAFENCTALTTITVPDSVKVIGDNAFDGCSMLSKVTAPASIIYTLTNNLSTLENVTITSGTVIPSYAFYQATKLTTVSIPDTVTKIDIRAFFGCNSLQYVKMPESLERIEKQAFAGTSSLIRVNFKNNLKYIGESAFSSSGISGTLAIPDSVEYIGGQAFDSNNITKLYVGSGFKSHGDYPFAYLQLEEVMVSPENEYFYSVDNCLIEISTGEVFVGTVNSVIPATENVVGLAAIAFYGRGTKITSITIPTNITGIGYACFSGCSKLADIYYLGTQDEWNAITFGESWLNLDQVGQQCTIHFSDGTSITEKYNEYGG